MPLSATLMHALACANCQHRAEQVDAAIGGAQGPAKIVKVTLMRPFHGNLLVKGERLVRYEVNAVMALPVFRSLRVNGLRNGCRLLASWLARGDHNVHGDVVHYPRPHSQCWRRWRL